MRTQVTFSEIKMRREIRVECPVCHKKRPKVVSRSYYRNGFHNEQETRRKYDEEIRAEIAGYAEHGLICCKCEAAIAKAGEK